MLGGTLRVVGYVCWHPRPCQRTRRIIDVEREALLLVCIALEAMRERCIAALEPSAIRAWGPHCGMPAGC
jgi:hypothetical protein